MSTDKLAEALRAVLNRDERNTCSHEETHRGGVLWTICNSCGAKWADDEGGMPEWQDPPEWEQAREALAAYEAEAKPADERAAFEAWADTQVGSTDSTKNRRSIIDVWQE